MLNLFLWFWGLSVQDSLNIYLSSQSWLLCRRTFSDNFPHVLFLQNISRFKILWMNIRRNNKHCWEWLYSPKSAVLFLTISPFYWIVHPKIRRCSLNECLDHLVSWTQECLCNPGSLRRRGKEEMLHSDKYDPVPTFLRHIMAIKFKITLFFTFKWYISTVCFLCSIVNKVMFTFDGTLRMRQNVGPVPTECWCYENNNTLCAILTNACHSVNHDDHSLGHKHLRPWCRVLIQAVKSDECVWRGPARCIIHLERNSWQ